MIVTVSRFACPFSSVIRNKVTLSLLQSHKHAIKVRLSLTLADEKVSEEFETGLNLRSPQNAEFFKFYSPVQDPSTYTCNPPRNHLPVRAGGIDGPGTEFERDASCGKCRVIAVGDQVLHFSSGSSLRT